MIQAGERYKIPNLVSYHITLLFFGRSPCYFLSSSGSFLFHCKIKNKQIKSNHQDLPACQIPWASILPYFITVLHLILQTDRSLPYSSSNVGRKMVLSWRPRKGSSWALQSTLRSCVLLTPPSPLTHCPPQSAVSPLQNEVPAY